MYFFFPYNSSICPFTKVQNVNNFATSAEMTLRLPPALWPPGRPAAASGTSLCSGPAGSGSPLPSEPQRASPRLQPGGLPQPPSARWWLRDGESTRSPRHSNVIIRLLNQIWRCFPVFQHHKQKAAGSLGETMRLTVDLVDVALDLGLCEQLIVDVPLCVCVLQLLKRTLDTSPLWHVWLLTLPGGKLADEGAFLYCFFYNLCIWALDSKVILPSPWF